MGGCVGGILEKRKKVEDITVRVLMLSGRGSARI